MEIRVPGPEEGWRCWVVLWNQLEGAWSRAGLPGAAGPAVSVPALAPLPRHRLVIALLVLFCFGNELRSLHFKAEQAALCLANDLIWTAIIFYGEIRRVVFAPALVLCFNFRKRKQRTNAYVPDLTDFHVIDFSQ